MKMISDSLVMSRHFCLTAHLVILLVLFFWKREELIVQSLPFMYLSEEYSEMHREITVYLSLSIAGIALEMIGFIRGVSMFSWMQNMISLLCHLVGAVGLCCLLLNTWDSIVYRWIFVISNALPAITEIITIVMYIVHNL